MVKYTIKRFFAMLVTLFIIATATFFCWRQSPATRFQSGRKSFRNRFGSISIKNTVWISRLWNVT